MRTYRTLAERLRRELGRGAVARRRASWSSGCARRRRRPGRRRARRRCPARSALVGRERELSELESTWEAVCAGTGAAAVIRGEAGIGKTRLASELRARARPSGGLTAVSAALDLGGTAPLSLWAELIRELLPALTAPPAEAAWPDDLAVLTAELPAHFGRSGTPITAVAPDLQRTRLFEAVVALLGWAARPGAGAARTRGRSRRRRPEPRAGRVCRASRGGAAGDDVVHPASAPRARRRRPSGARAPRARTAGVRARARAAGPVAGGGAGARGGPSERGRRRAGGRARRRQRAARGRDGPGARARP